MAEQEPTYDESPSGEAQRWRSELDSSKRWLEKSRQRGEETLKVYLDERDSTTRDSRRLALLYSDTQIKIALLYGRMPKVSAGRRWEDPNDDVARVGSVILDRLLNSDIEEGSDTYTEALHNCLEDWLLPGLAQVRARYQADLEDVPEQPEQVDPATGRVLPAVPAHQRKANEQVFIDYIPWRYFRYSPCGTWNDCRWVAFGIPMSRRQCMDRFGEKAGRAIPLTERAAGQTKDEAENDPTARALVWEIWCKEDKRVHWYAEGYPTILDQQDDPLGLSGFFPCPAPLVANPTTSKFAPTPDYYIHQDKYRGCDTLFSRICQLEDAVSVRGIFNKNCKGIEVLVQNTDRNQLIGIENWDSLGGKEGIAAAIFWLPLDQIAGAIQILTAQLAQKVNLLQQETGISDIMRGQAQSAATATEQGIKAKYGNIRGQKKQEEFSRFATAILKIKAEIISKHFDVETIVRDSNMANTEDADKAMAAAQLVKEDFAGYRIEVKPEALSLEDMAALKAERTEFMAALAPMLQQVVGAAQTVPDIVPAMLDMVKWAMASLRGASTIEGVLDRATDAWKQKLQMAQMQPPQPPPEAMKAQAQMQLTQMKGQADLAKIQATAQADLMRIAAEAQAEVQKQKAQTDFNVREELARAQIKSTFEPPPPPEPAQ